MALLLRLSPYPRYWRTLHPRGITTTFVPTTVDLLWLTWFPTVPIPMQLSYTILSILPYKSAKITIKKLALVSLHYKSWCFDQQISIFCLESLSTGIAFAFRTPMTDINMTTIFCTLNLQTKFLFVVLKRQLLQQTENEASCFYNWQ